MRVLFFGTPEIAAKCLAHLLDENHTVVGVVCQPDKPKGRGNKLTPPPVKMLAEARGIPVFQPISLRDGTFLPTVRDLAPDVCVVVAYGRILPPALLSVPPLGCINLHVSLLPLYRGAAPMQRAIMAGERETGVCVMHMDEGMDTGDVIFCERYPILPTDDYGAVSEKAAAVGAPLLGRALEALRNGTAPRHPQDHSRATYAPKIEKEECVLDFTRPADRLDCLIRALSPEPLATFFDARGQVCKAVSAHPAALPPTGEKPAPGTVLSVSTKGEGEIVVACGEGALALTALIPAGKKRMSAAAFVCGRGVAAGDVLS